MRAVRPRSVPAPSLTFETLFTPGGTPPTFDGNDTNGGTALITGAAFTPTVAGSCYGVRFRINTSATGTVVAYLYDDATSTLLASANGPTNPAAGSYDIMFSSPVTLTATTGRYTVSVLHPDGTYSFNNTNWWDTFGADYTSPSGHLFAAFNGAYGPGRFVVSATAANPTTQTNHYYGAEPLFIAS